MSAQAEQIEVVLVGGPFDGQHTPAAILAGEPSHVAVGESMAQGQPGRNRQCWFNHRRLVEPIGDVPPAEFEDAYYAKEGTEETEGLRDPRLR